MSEQDRILCQSTVCRPEEKGGPLEANGIICPSCAERFPHNINAIADAFTDLAARIVSPEDYVITERVHGSKDSHGLDINEQVSDAKDDLLKFTRWMVSMVTALRPSAKQPPETGVPDTLRWVARWHPQVFTRDLDADNVIRAVSVAHHTRHNVHRNAYPSGSRRIDIPGNCMEDVTTDGGETLPCPGELFGLIRPGDSRLPSTIICSENPEHNVPSSEWVKLGRRLRKDRKVAA